MGRLAADCDCAPLLTCTPACRPWNHTCRLEQVVRRILLPVPARRCGETSHGQDADHGAVVAGACGQEGRRQSAQHGNQVRSTWLVIASDLNCNRSVDDYVKKDADFKDVSKLDKVRGVMLSFKRTPNLVRVRSSRTCRPC